MPTSSRSSRALTWLAVSLSPSWPASGEELIPIVTDSEGSSTVIAGSGRGSSASASVSPIVISGIPATEMISPAAASSASTRVERLGDVQLADPDPLDGSLGAAPGDRLAAADAPVAQPTDRDPADVRGGVEIGHVRLERMPGVVLGRGNVLEQQLEQRLQIRRPATPGASEAHPALAFVYTIGNSICDSSASRSRNSS